MYGIRRELQIQVVRFRCVAVEKFEPRGNFFNPFLFSVRICFTNFLQLWSKAVFVNHRFLDNSYKLNLRFILASMSLYFYFVPFFPSNHDAKRSKMFCHFLSFFMLEKYLSLFDRHGLNVECTMYYIVSG